MMVSLPPYPAARSLVSLSPSQLLQLHKKISSALRLALDQPESWELNSAFLASYAKENARQTLESLIWGSTQKPSQYESLVKFRTLLLAEKSTTSPQVHTLVDLAIIYSTINITKLRTVFKAADTVNLAAQVKFEVVPAFTALLSNSLAGLYTLRKACHCVCSFLQACGPMFVQQFSRDKNFVLSITRVYDQGLSAMAQTYGGLANFQRAESRELDEWERLWLECKVALVDSFHVLASELLQTISNASGENSTDDMDNAFDILFAIQEPSPSSASAQRTPFLNQSLLADYQQAYRFSQSLTKAFSHTEDRDARADLLESGLKSLDTSSRGPGALKLLLRTTIVSSNGKGKEPATAATLPDPKVEQDVQQVLDILPDHQPEYIRALLSSSSYPFSGSAEKVVEALLEGTAPSEEQIFEERRAPAFIQDEFSKYAAERRNAFDGQRMDSQQLRIGKKSDDTVLQDRAAMDEMKASILKRVEEISDDEEQDTLDIPDEFEDGPSVKVGGDGEGSDSGEDEEEIKEKSPETILELAYIQDPKQFDRDGNTRRSKARAELKSRTGWEDEQIEGWRIMLERNPQKEKILQKHEFSGNKPIPPTQPQPIASQGRGRGRGGGGRGAVQERAWKDKHKASRANHNRKRGHDKKMAQAAGPSHS